MLRLPVPLPIASEFGGERGVRPLRSRVAGVPRKYPLNIGGDCAAVLLVR
jgi:hypothetical protein